MVELPNQSKQNIVSDLMGYHVVLYKHCNVFTILVHPPLNNCFFSRFLWWTSQLASLTFLELICLYGYSLVVYIPVSVLWLIQYR